MKESRQKRLTIHRSATPEIASAFRHLLEDKYRRVLLVAQHEWQRSFGQNDPTDACVSVRISGSFVPRLRDAA